ncbi:MAG TPA: hypothetical protein VFQ88_06925 [Nevskiaceae bacterium]|nr:hypothetical protein [Nevskiaceae bacterium]
MKFMVMGNRRRLVVAGAMAALLWVGTAAAQGTLVGATQGGVRSSALENQADALMQQLGYGDALPGVSGQQRAGITGLGPNGHRRFGGGPGVGFAGSGNSGALAVQNQAQNLRRQLRLGVEVGQTPPLPRAPTGLVPPVPGLARPDGLSSRNPAMAGVGGIPGQDSPYTSSGNAAGFRPYPTYPIGGPR